MKKILAFLVTAVMLLTVLTGCGDPVYDDFENFLNTEMTEVNENYDKIAEETEIWANLEDDEDLIAGLEEDLLPLVEDSLAKLEKIEPETDEVKELKEKYVAVMEAYKEGFELVLAGIKDNDADEIYAGNDKLSEGLSLLDEYNDALDALAKEVDAEIEY